MKIKKQLIFKLDFNLSFGLFLIDNEMSRFSRSLFLSASECYIFFFSGNLKFKEDVLLYLFSFKNLSKKGMV